MSLVKNFSRNLQYQVYGIAIAGLVTFFLTPFILKRVDPALYGIYVLMYSIVNYLNIMDFGINSATVKYVAEYNAKQDWSELNKILNQTITLFTGIGVVCALIIVGLSFTYQNFFKVPGEFVGIGRIFMWITGIELVLSMFFLPIKGALNGLQRADIIKKINMVATVLKLPFVTLCFHFFDPTTAFVIYLIIDGLFVNVLYGLSFRLLKNLCPHYQFRLFFFDQPTLHKIFKFSIFIFFGSITSLIIFQTDTVVIAAFVSTALVTYYSVGLALANQMRSINGILGGPVFLAVAHLAGLNDQEKNRFMLFKGTRFMNAIYAPIILITVIFCEMFIINWLGPTFAISVLPARILLIYWLGNGHMEIASGFLTTRGNVDLVFYMNLINAIANLVLSLILVHIWGIVGVAIGTCIPMVLFTLATLYVCLRKLHISIREFFREALLKNMIFYLVPILLAWQTITYFPVTDIYLTIFEMAIVFGLSELIYFIFFMDKEEKGLILRIAKVHL